MPHRSYWLADALGAEADLPHLSAPDRCDVAIVGGGFVGLWTALRLKEADPSLDVVVLERDICGGGASGRNGGEVLSWWAKAGKLAPLCGRDETIRLCRASEDAIGEIEAFCSAHGIDAQFDRAGYLWTAVAEHQIGAWESTIATCAEFGVEPYVRLPPEEVARRAGSPVHRAGVLDASAATIHPGRLVRGLRRVALERGVRIYEKTAMTDFDRTAPVLIRTNRGEIEAGRMVLATNAWAASLPELRRRLVVISSDIVITPPIADRLDAIGWTGGEAISDSAVMIHYYRRTRDGRVMFGKGGWGIALGGRVPRSFDRDETRAADVLASFHRIYPTLGDIQPATHWSGPIDRSPDGLPVIGRLADAPQVIYGVGWSGNGVGPSLVGSRILASLALDADDAWARSSLVGDRPGRLPPEPVRYAGAHLVRTAVVRLERALVAGRRPSPVDAFLAGFAPEGIIPKKTS